MIDSLKALGLSELEAKCYLALHEESGLSGYEIAKRVSASRSNVYASLRSLADKGACLVSDGDPVRYDAVPARELLRKLRSEFERTAERLQQELLPPARAVPTFYNWQGAPALQSAAERVCANAERSLIADLWAEDLPWVEAALLEAESRGVTVVVVALGEVKTALRNVLLHKRSEAWPSYAARKFSLLGDSQRALLGSFGGEVKASALETDHPAVIETLKNAWVHDLLMMHIEKDFGSQLSAAYGDHYGKLLHYYMKEKGWDV